ncbi:Retrovirus-related Pol polyprotein from transposon [Dictyocoela muelleri]|nr:Retrovirus-related Pol polyprotein from transposon [Dictyocoela muelleri]
MLEDIDKQDIFIWRDEVLESAKISGWNDETLMAVIRAISSTKIHRLFETSRTSQEMIDTVFKIKYPASHALRFLNIISNIRQNNYYTIREYKEDIEAACQRLSIYLNWDVHTTNFKSEEIFYNGLNRRTQLEMSRLRVTNIREMYELINTTEDTIIEQMRSHKIKEEKTYRKVSNEKAEENKKPVRVVSKWCTFHKTATHSDTECRALKKGGEKDKRNSDTKPSSLNMLVQEPMKTLMTVEIETIYNDRSLKCVIDTGSTYNIIKKEILNSDEIIENIELPLNLEMINGNKITTNQFTMLNLSLQSDITTVYRVKFLILEGIQPEIILGIPFLQENDAKIDFKNNIILLEGKEYEFSEAMTCNTPDKTILDKSKILACAKSKEKECEKLLKDFNKTSPQLGHSKIFYHHINLTRDLVISKKPYKIPHQIFTDCLKELDELERIGVIKKSLYPYSSPAFPIRKKNGKIRIVVDFRELNKITTPQYYPLPSIMDMLQQLGGSTIFTQLDLNSGYYQIPLSEKTIPLTGFSMCNRHYVFLRMPFGLVNAPRTFQQAMLSILGHLDFVKVFLDDILIHSTNTKTHYDHLKTVLQIIRDNGFSINLEKSKICVAEVNFLGHIVNSKGIKADTTALKKITDIKPRNKRDVQKILGLLNRYRPFIQKMADKTFFLTNKLKNDQKF